MMVDVGILLFCDGGLGCFIAGERGFGVIVLCACACFAGALVVTWLVWIGCGCCMFTCV